MLEVFPLLIAVWTIGAIVVANSRRIVFHFLVLPLLRLRFKGCVLLYPAITLVYCAWHPNKEKSAIFEVDAASIAESSLFYYVQEAILDPSGIFAVEVLFIVSAHGFWEAINENLVPIVHLTQCGKLKLTNFGDEFQAC
jgi:hypothetical protein